MSSVKQCIHCGFQLPEGASVCSACGASVGGAGITLSDGGLPTFSGRKRLMDGRYEVVCELGRGGMGVVYQAIDHARGADVALKMLPAQLESDERAIANLKREVNLALQLTHENICRVYDFQRCLEGQFISMEYIDGPSLEKLLVRQMEKGKNGFPLEKVLEWLEPICAALDYAHKKNIVHRDLKPANILISRAGVVKITDFGLARVIHTSMTKYSREPIGGTALYMSPEQCRGKPTDARSDIYSLGMMTYELLTGEAPFAEAADAINCQIHEDVDPIPGMSEFVNAALLAAIAKQPDKRPQAAGSFLKMLTNSRPIVEIVTTGIAARPATPLSPSPASPARAKAVPQERMPAKTRVQTSTAGKTKQMAGFSMTYCPSGQFMMGSPDGEKGSLRDEICHEIAFDKGFWIGTWPVTRREWMRVMKADPLGQPDLSVNAPITGISWLECQAFLARLRDTTGIPFRLPTEAEWEYACRAGSQDRFCCGDDEATLANYAWFDDKAGAPQPVKHKKPNNWGIYDMHGNVWEWCQEWYGPYNSGPPVEPKEPDAGKERVIRGGAFITFASYCRSAKRAKQPPEQGEPTIGFRLALDDEQVRKL